VTCEHVQPLMTPNPTLRPFVVGGLLFLTLIGLWPGRATASRDLAAPPSSITATRR
jgi:hypothetical protein